VNSQLRIVNGLLKKNQIRSIAERRQSVSESAEANIHIKMVKLNGFIGQATLKFREIISGSETLN
jgi:hypothetical protein